MVGYQTAKNARTTTIPVAIRAGLETALIPRPCPAVPLPASLPPTTPANVEPINLAPEQSQALERWKTHVTTRANRATLRRRHTSLERHGRRPRGNTFQSRGGFEPVLGGGQSTRRTSVNPVPRPFGCDKIRVLGVDPKEAHESFHGINGLRAAHPEDVQIDPRQRFSQEPTVVHGFVPKVHSIVGHCD